MLWTIDPTHTNVTFAVKHMAISTVRGSFERFTASGETDDRGLPTSLQMEIEAASVSTNNEQRDGHLRSADFFDAAHHPTLTFRSTGITGTPDALTIAGDLTIRGVTRPVTLKAELSETVKDPWGSDRASLAITGRIKRSEWGLTWNQALEFGGVLVSDEVRLEIEAQGVAAAVEGTAVGA